MDDLESKIVCLYQFIKSSRRSDKEGFGDCQICEYDPINNKRCKGYYPIHVWFIKVYKQNSIQY